MKGVNYIVDSRKRIKAVVIDIKTINKHQGELEDFLDAIVASSRKDSSKRSWEKVKTSLKEKKKL